LISPLDWAASDTPAPLTATAQKIAPIDRDERGLGKDDPCG
jgi:hypothetical protein